MIKAISKIVLILSFALLSCSGSQNDVKQKDKEKNISAKEILGNVDYQAISYGGYRYNTRDKQPTVEELKEDMKLLSALGIKIIRTYQTQLAHPHNVLKAIRELKEEDSSFEMYMMVGAWIDCEGAWTGQVNHDKENVKANTGEIERAVKMANDYPDIVKIIAVGNEAMVKWAASYFVQPGIILKWVDHLQSLKKDDKLPADLWITSSDNFASWGGGDASYHTEDLKRLIKSVDYVSMHTYPMHDTHYNPAFWGVSTNEEEKSAEDKIQQAMERALDYAKNQYKTTSDFIKSIDPTKPIHIGETGWASASNSLYGPDGSKATDEYKEAIYYKMMREWTNANRISCFYFEGFDEPWKDANNPGGSENHFGLFTVDGKAKYAIWDKVDEGVFDNLTRGENKITKTYDGKLEELMRQVQVPSLNKELDK